MTVDRMLEYDEVYVDDEPHDVGQTGPAPADDDYAPDISWIGRTPDPPDEDRTPPTVAAPGPLPDPIDWPAFWDRDHRADDWAIPQIVPAGRLVTIWATRKTGKSLLALDLAAAAATGRPILGQDHVTPTDVIYLDFEMTEDDLEERLGDLGYGPDSDLSRFHYYLLPTLPPLDDYAGGAALMQLVERHHATVVVLDTLSRVIAGDENSADTFRAFYRCTGLALKQAGIATLRLDHAGKEKDRGERGSSAKGDDVDLAWELRDAGGGEYLLKRSYTRLSWVPEAIKLRREAEPLRHVIAQDTWPAGTAACAKHLEDLALPVDTTVDSAVKALREAELTPRAKAVVTAAVRWRRSSDSAREGREPPREPSSATPAGTGR
jgi:hypothetical protein